MRRFMKDVNKRCECSFVFLNLAAVLKNSSPGKFVYIWQIERDQVNTIEFDIIHINFFSNVFTVVVIVFDLLPNNLLVTNYRLIRRASCLKLKTTFLGYLGYN